jgi:hypothetical protein
MNYKLMILTDFVFFVFFELLFAEYWRAIDWLWLFRRRRFELRDGADFRRLNDNDVLARLRLVDATDEVDNSQWITLVLKRGITFEMSNWVNDDLNNNTVLL